MIWSHYDVAWEESLIAASAFYCVGSGERHGPPRRLRQPCLTPSAVRCPRRGAGWPLAAGVGESRGPTVAVIEAGRDGTVLAPSMLQQ